MYSLNKWAKWQSPENDSDLHHKAGFFISFAFVVAIAIICLICTNTHIGMQAYVLSYTI